LKLPPPIFFGKGKGIFLVGALSAEAEKGGVALGGTATRALCKLQISP